MTHQHKTTFYTSSALGIAIILFLLVNMLSSSLLSRAKLDLTENKLYTITAGTKKILSQLDEPITLRLFYSEKLNSEIPAYGILADRVKNLLKSFATYANGKVRLEFINPEPFSDMEDLAIEFGLKGVPLNTTGELVYFGLVGTNSTNGQIRIPIQPNKEPFLEYDIARLIYDLSYPKKPKVAVYSSLPIYGDLLPTSATLQDLPTPPWKIIDNLRIFFNILPLNNNFTSIADDIDLLLLIHPKDLSEMSLYAIDQYVLKGGKGAIFVDPFCETEMAKSGQGQLDPSSTLDPLFKAWGIEFSTQSIIGDRGVAQLINTQDNDGRIVQADYVAHLNLISNNLNQDDPVTQPLQLISMDTVGAFDLKEGADIQFTPLISSTPNAMTIPTTKFRFVTNPLDLLENFKSEKSFTLAARIQGHLPTAFPKGAPQTIIKAANTSTKSSVESLKTSEQPANILLVGDVDILNDVMWLQIQDFFGQQIATPYTDNADFLINALDHLTGSEDLISLRSRGKSAREFEKIKELRDHAEEKFREQEQILKETLIKLTDEEMQILEKNPSPNQTILLTPEQQKQIQTLRQQQLKTRNELRKVQKSLQHNIKSLENRLIAINIVLVPLFVVLVAIGLAWFRYRKRHFYTKKSRL